MGWQDDEEKANLVDRDKQNGRFEPRQRIDAPSLDKSLWKEETSFPINHKTDPALHSSHDLRHDLAKSNTNWLGQNQLQSLPEALQSRITTWVATPFALALGIACFFQLRFEPSIWLIGILLGIAVVLFTANFFAATIFVPSTWLFMMTALGFSAGGFETWRHSTPVFVGKPILYEGPAKLVRSRTYVRDQNSQGSARMLYRLRIEDPPKNLLAQLSNPHASRITVDAWGAPISGLVVGDSIVAEGFIRRGNRALSNGAFNTQRWAFFEGVAGQMTLRKTSRRLPRHNLDGADGLSAFERAGLFWARLADRADQRIQQILPQPQAGLASALLTGRRGHIDAETMEQIRRSGLAHLIAISGLHIGLVFAGLFILMRLIFAFSATMSNRRSGKRTAAIIALVAVLSYTALTGGSVPTLRACLMMAMVVVAIWLGRNPFSLSLLAFAACVILLIWPSSALGPSFQLSFAVVTALILFAQWATNRRSKDHWEFQAAALDHKERKGVFRALWRTLPTRSFRYLTGILFTSLIASLVSLPLTFAFFQSMPLIGIFANLVAIPLTAFIILPFGLIGLLLMPFGGESIALEIANFGLSGVLWTAQISSQFKAFEPLWMAPPPFAFVLFWLAIAALVFARRKVAFAGLAMVGFIGLTLWQTPPDALILHEGRGVAMIADNEALILDVNGHWSVSKTNRKRLQKRLAVSALTRLKSPSKTLPPAFGDWRCDPESCVMKRGSQKLAIALSPQAVHRFCGASDVLIVPWQRIGALCKIEETRTIEPIDMARHGPMEISVAEQPPLWGGEAIRISTHSQRNAHRVWSGLQNSKAESQ